MPPIPSISGKQAIRVFEKLGWEIVRQKGSHVILVKDGHRATLSIPLHKNLAKGTLKSILRNAQLSTEDFLKTHSEG